MKIHKFHPYEMKNLQELHEDDYDKRTEFCEGIISDRLKTIYNLVINMCFSDEYTFFLNGNVNKQISRYRSGENPHIFQERHTQYPQKVNVWAGILGYAIIVPLFLNEKLTGNLYLVMLE